MANITQTDKQLLELVLNKLESPEVFNYMDENNLLESDQLYFVINNDERTIAEYDKDNNGIVDNSERLGGELPEFYASQEDLVELKEDVLKSEIVNIDFGDTIVLNDTADNKPLYGLKLYGKTTQDGIPSLTNPIPLVGIDEGMSVSVAVCGAVLMDIPDFELVNPTARTKRILADATLPAGEYSLKLSFSATATRTEARCQRFEGSALKDENCGQLALTDGVVTFVATKPWNVLYVYIPASQEEGAAASISNAALTFSLYSDTDERYKGVQTAEVSVSGGLQGVPVVSGGNYTDEGGQQWICDEVNFERGVYIKRIEKLTFTEADNWRLDSNSSFLVMSHGKSSGWSVGKSVGLCSALPWTTRSAGNGVAVNGQQIRIGKETVIEYGLTPENVGASLAGQMIIWDMRHPEETPLTTEEIAAYKALHTNKPVTTILNDGAGMAVAYAPDNESAEALIDYIPTVLPNPYTLNFTGVVETEYDGSKEVTVNIPTIKGENGIDGKSAYQIAIDNGFEGTEQEWLASLKGEPGIEGEPGQNGQPGEDGAPGVGIVSVEQTVTSEESGGVNVVTVAKTDGTTSTFEVRNGIQGEQGPEGSQGEPGKDGYTPVKGVDYFTEADKTGFLNNVTSRIGTVHGANLLHNADWAYSLVNQRAHTGDVVDAYCIDRWIGDGSVAPTQGQYIALTKNTTMTQRMEIIPAALFGKKCTFSIDVNGTAQVVSLSFPASAAAAAETASLACGTIELGFISGTFKLCGVSCTAVPYVKFTAGMSIQARRVFLELGEVSHMAETPPMNYGSELAVCERYLLPLAGDHATAYVVTANLLFFNIPVPVTLRTKPTLVGTMYVKNTSGTTQADFEITSFAAPANYLSIQARKPSHGLTTGYISGTAGSFASAEL